MGRLAARSWVFFFSIAAGSGAMAQRDDQAPPPPEVCANEAAAADSAAISAQERDTILKALQTQRRIAEFRKAKPDEVRAEVAGRAAELIGSVLDLKLGADGKFPLDAAQVKLRDELVSAAFDDEPTPPPPSPTTPPAEAEKTPRIDADLATIVRVAEDHWKQLLADKALSDAAREDRLVQFIRLKFARAADIELKDLDPAEEAKAKSVAADLIRGKPAPELPKLDSRITDPRGLADAIRAESRRLVLEGSVPTAVNHRDQLLEFARKRSREMFKIVGDFKPTEGEQIGALVEQVRFNSLPSGNTETPTTVTPDLRQRILNLLRQINNALTSLGFDPGTRRATMAKFVVEKFAGASGESDTLIDQVLRESPQPPATPQPIVTTQPTLVAPAQVPVYVLTPTHPSWRHRFKRR